MKKLFLFAFAILTLSSCSEKTNIEKVESMLDTYVDNHCDKIKSSYEPIATIPCDSVFKVDESKIDALADLASMAVKNNIDVDLSSDKNIEAMGEFIGILYKQTFRFKNEYGNEETGELYLLTNKDYTNHISVNVDYDAIKNENMLYHFSKIK